MVYGFGSTQIGRVFPNYGGTVTSTKVLPETSASPESGINCGHRNVPHKSKHSYISTPDSSRLRGHPNRAPFCSDQVFQKWPNYPLDSTIRGTSAHLQILTDIHYNFAGINLIHSRSPHGALPIHIETQIPRILWLNYITTNINIIYPFNNLKLIRLLQECSLDWLPHVTTGHGAAIIRNHAFHGSE